MREQGDGLKSEENYFENRLSESLGQFMSSLIRDHIMD